MGSHEAPDAATDDELARLPGATLVRVGTNDATVLDVRARLDASFHFDVHARERR